MVLRIITWEAGQLLSLSHGRVWAQISMTVAHNASQCPQRREQPRDCASSFHRTRPFECRF